MWKKLTDISGGIRSSSSLSSSWKPSLTSCVRSTRAFWRFSKSLRWSFIAFTSSFIWSYWRFNSLLVDDRDVDALLLVDDDDSGDSESSRSLIRELIGVEDDADLPKNDEGWNVAILVRIWDSEYTNTRCFVTMYVKVINKHGVVTNFVIGSVPKWPESPNANRMSENSSFTRQKL